MSAFLKTEQTDFAQLVAGFRELNVVSSLFRQVKLTPMDLERSYNNTLWRPMPYIMRSFTGTNQTGNFQANTQLAVPITANQNISTPFTLGPTEMNDPEQLNRLMKAAIQKHATEIEVACATALATQATRVIKRTASASGMSDMSLAAGILNDVGVEKDDRYFLYNTIDYYSAAESLSGRQTFKDDVAVAYKDGKLPNKICDFATYSASRIPTLNAATATGVTINGANQFYTPIARNPGQNTTGDPRYQNINITVTSSTVKVGDCFTVAGVFDMSMHSKQVMPNLKTFRITAIVSGAGGSGTVTISPPIISGQGATTAELQYRNCSATPANGAAITFLNTVSRQPCLFFYGEACEILPYQLPQLPTGGGIAQMRASTGYDDGSGISLSVYRSADINTINVNCRLDSAFGVGITNPDMCGIVLNNQV